MTPKIKIEGPLKVGDAVYLSRNNKIATTDKENASKEHPDPIGKILAGPSIKLNVLSENALASLE